MTTLYRAMSEDEARATLQHRYPAFIRRWKWFSHDAAWVQGRVMDGRFNRSDAKPGRYTRLLAFTFPDEDAQWFQRGRIEWALDRRKAHHVRWQVADAPMFAQVAE